MGDTSVSNNKYLSLTTFKRDGTPKSTPVWIVDLGDGTMGFTTPSSSWKVKRIANNDQVLLQASDSRGRPNEGTEAVAGTARVHVGGTEFERVKAVVRQKYGFQHMLIGAFGKLMGLIGKGSSSDSAVIITVP